jgi:hypothetical protein
MVNSEQIRKEKRNVSVEIDRKKHKTYKLYAVRKGIKLKKLTEMALDEFIKNN